MSDEEMAEKYAKGLCKTCKVDVCRYSKIQTCATKESLKQAYLAGAEFGFQKGIKAKINTTTISDCPIKDEWHYVKDGIMPEENQWVLVYDGSYTVCNYHSNTPIKWLDNYENEVYEGNIVAWKEIVLPEGDEW